MTENTAALTAAYRDPIAVAEEVDGRIAWLPTGCAGWAVADLLLHLLFDAQRALVAMATPAAGPIDRDAVTYWADFQSPSKDPEFRHTRTLRTVAATWSLRDLVETCTGTARAVLVLTDRTPPEALVSTQGHVLRTDDLISTLVVEAAIHHLDLAATSRWTGPGPAPLAVVRQILDGLLGHPSPTSFDDRSWALLATGRRPAGSTEITALGTDVARLPLLC